MSESWTWDWYYWDNFFNDKEVKTINNFIENNYDMNENPDLGTEYKKVSTVKNIQYKKVKHLISEVVDSAIRVAQKGFGYNIFKTNNNDFLNYNIYNSNTRDNYDWHWDKSYSATYDTKLTLLINLSDEYYEGGDFQVLTGNKEQTIEGFSKSGSVFMFKSYILHRVTPVTSGVRKSLALWIDGPKFQ